MNTKTNSRRALLKSMPLAASMLPWLRPTLGHSASAVPTRLLLFWSGSGVPRQAYSIKAAGGGMADGSDFVFPEVRAPLNAIKKDLIAFENLDMVSATVDRTTPGNAHSAAETHSLAATNRANADTPGGPSIDQYIAKAINTPTPVTRIPSLPLHVQVDGNVSYIKVCTSGSGQVVSLQVSPSAVYKRLFTGFMPPAGMKPVMPAGPSDTSLQDRSVLDLVLSDFDALRLGGADQTKLDAHASAIRDLEKRLALGTQMSTAMPGAGCKDPTADVLKGAGNTYPGTAAMYRANFDAMSRLVQGAFACDMTRVALLSLGEPFASDWGYNSGAYGSTDPHDLIHKTSFNGGGTLKGNADAMKAVTALHQLECKQFMTMLDLLRQVPEADGKSLLDHTIVLWCSQIAEHGHDVNYLPWIVGGGSSAGFAPGRYLRYDRTGNKGAPHNNLFVSLAQGMGVSTNTFGNANVCTGPLARLRA